MASRIFFNSLQDRNKINTIYINGRSKLVQMCYQEQGPCETSAGYQANDTRSLHSVLHQIVRSNID
jgi:hypothetical protein